MDRKLVEAPLFFERNRVFRVYLGGKQFSRLCGDKDEDGMFPEEWVASNVKAINSKSFGERDGVSVIKDTDIFFDDLLKSEEELLLGGRKFDCLVKYLDSAIRLPMQVHPDKEYSRKYFNSDYGKTEAWLIVDTRPDARIYFGFHRNITKEELSALEEQSAYDSNIMESVLCEVKAEIGDVYLIRGGLAHAIGAGCTVIEVQEPTDFTIQPESLCGTYRLNNQEKFMGLPKSVALDCFDYSLVGEKAVASAKIEPKLMLKIEGYRKYSLISHEDTICFAENKHLLEGGCFVMDYGPSVWIVLDGVAEITGKNYQKTVTKGEYFFLPYAAENRYRVSGHATLIECIPSKQ